MKVKLLKSKSEDRWYAKEKGHLMGKIFKVHFSETASKTLQRSVFEIKQEITKENFLM